MNRLRGIVTEIRHATETGGLIIDGLPISTDHITTFMIGGRYVVYVGRNPAFIKEGDEVAVVGNLKKGRLMAMAYRNITSGVWDDNAQGWALIIFGWLLMIFGLVGGSLLLLSGNLPGAAFIACGLVVLGLCLRGEGDKRQKVIKMLDELSGGSSGGDFHVMETVNRRS